MNLLEDTPQLLPFATQTDEHIRFFVIFVQLSAQKERDMVRVNQNSAYKERNIAFLEEYAQREGVKILFNGVMYREITKGKGDKPSPKALITVHYTGKLNTGTV